MSDISHIREGSLPDDAELHTILMNFRNAIQADRDRLYKTRNTSVEGIKLAHKKAELAIGKLIRSHTRQLEQRVLKAVGPDEELKPWISNAGGVRNIIRAELRTKLKGVFHEY